MDPLISVIIPTLNRPRELRLCLEGFTRQTTPGEQFEVVVVDDGSTEDIAQVVAEFQKRIRLRFVGMPHAGLAAARNTGIRMAGGGLLILYDDDLSPLPVLVARCLEFHAEEPAEGAAELLQFGLDPELARSPIKRWSFDRLYSFPASPGPQHLGCFWGGAVTCKRSLFRYGLFDPTYLSVEDAEFATRISQQMDLRVMFRGDTTGIMTRGITLSQLYRREYFRGYFQYKLAQDYPQVWSFDWEPYRAPESHILPPEELQMTLAMAAGMEGLVTSGGNGTSRQRFGLLVALWRRVEHHAKSSGWVAAREGRRFDAAEAEFPGRG